jgi:ATP-binding cassette subfamily B protein/ATP-binding cassette subfamily C protein
MAATGKEVMKLSGKQRLVSLLRVAKISYKAAPSILYLRIVSAILDSVLPLATTFFAAQTTTELARAYNGEPGAGDAAIMYVVLTALLGVITTAWSSFERYVSRFARYKLESAISDQLINQFLSLDYWRYDDKDTADLLDKSRKFSNFFTYVFDTLGTILTGIFGLITSLVALAFVSWWLGLILLIAVVPGLVIQYRLSKQRVEHWSKNMDARRKANYIEWQLTQINHIAELRLYGLVRYLIDLRQKYRDKDEKQQIFIERRFVWKELLSNIIEAIAEVVALIYITTRIIAHAQPIGQFLYVQQVVSRGLGSMRQVVSSFINIDEDIANLFAYDEFMSLPIQKQASRRLKAAPTSIEVQSVSFQYPHNDQRILDEVSLTVEAGQHIAIVGENGAGKSTLIKLLLGLYEPTQGDIAINGISTRRLDLESWHAQVGVLQQSAVDFDYATARDNILFGDVARPASEERYQKAVTSAEAKEFLAKLPKKDDTYISQWMEDEDGVSGVALSGGQQQRLALARNFYRDSPVVILDEPTSAIDALAESRIFKRLFEEKDKLIITISHRLSTVRRADHIYVMEEGKIVEQGKHADLVRKKGAYYKLFESQL